MPHDRVLAESRRKPAKGGANVMHWVQRSIDGLMQELFYGDSLAFAKKQAAHKHSTTRILNPEMDIKQLMISAASLRDIWQFFVRRLTTGNGLDLLCFSVLDESGDFIRVKFLHPMSPEAEEAGYEPIISIADHQNHLVQAYQRKDTTFAASLKTLGRELETLIHSQVSPLEEETPPSPAMHLFSVPFIAGDRTIAMMTLGFSEMDGFSQAKLSYVYTLRDQIAQLVWNLVLQDRMKSQSQIDNLTGLLSYSYFQQILDKELDKTEQVQTSATVMLLDINNLQEINERLGHEAGDAAICHLASTVRRLIRGLDTVARYGGDDIVVLLPETDAETADVIAERFLQGIKASLPKGVQGIEDMSVSIGHATYPDDTKKRDHLLKLAEQALHLAKFKGSKTGESTRIASCEVDQLNEKTVLEVFASHVAKKYNSIQVTSVYQELVSHLEKKPLQAENSVTSIEKMKNDLMLETITSLACALDAKDRYTRGHSQAVANYAVALAHALKMTPEEVEEVRLAAFLHDIGKIGIPEAILLKEGPLSEAELEIMKQHPVIGAEQILAPVTSLRSIIPAVMHHHENWDGTGYPHGISGDAIPVGARIVSLVDAFHALTSDRAYRKALPVIEAKKILEGGSGSKWDPYLIEVFFKILTIASPAAPRKAEADTDVDVSRQAAAETGSEAAPADTAEAVAAAPDDEAAEAARRAAKASVRETVMNSPLARTAPKNTAKASSAKAVQLSLMD